MKESTIYDCTIVELDKHHSDKGNLTVVENGITVPFDINNTSVKIYRTKKLNNGSRVTGSAI